MSRDAFWLAGEDHVSKLEELYLSSELRLRVGLEQEIFIEGAMRNLGMVRRGTFHFVVAVCFYPLF